MNATRMAKITPVKSEMPFMDKYTIEGDDIDQSFYISKGAPISYVISEAAKVLREIVLERAAQEQRYPRNATEAQATLNRIVDGIRNLHDKLTSQGWNITPASAMLNIADVIAEAISIPVELKLRDAEPAQDDNLDAVACASQTGLWNTSYDAKATVDHDRARELHENLFAANTSQFVSSEPGYWDIVFNGPKEVRTVRHFRRHDDPKVGVIGGIDQSTSAYWKNNIGSDLLFKGGNANQAKTATEADVTIKPTIGGAMLQDALDAKTRPEPPMINGEAWQLGHDHRVLEVRQSRTHGWRTGDIHEYNEHIAVSKYLGRVVYTSEELP